MGLWCITSYFNPIGYKRRLANYRIFRRFLQAPLITVELGGQEDFELRTGDADVLVQLHGENWIWQKERLLNIALQSLPDACSAVAWLDCDVIFERDDWPRRVEVSLGKHTIVQPHSHCNDLPRSFDGSIEQLGPTSNDRTSLAYKLNTGQANSDIMAAPVTPPFRNLGCGLAWAARRGILEKHGLYDACINGSGDRAIASAALGKPQHGINYCCMQESWADHYLAWARPFHKAVHANLGHVEGRLYHLWHGELGNRRSPRHHLDFGRLQFDPTKDIVQSEEGCWRWNSDKAEMHRYIQAYFERRKEDG